MALAPREAGLHVGPHDSIGVVVIPLCPVGRDGSAERAVTPRPDESATASPALAEPPRRAVVAGHAPRRPPRACRPGSPRGGRSPATTASIRPARRSTSATSSRSSGCSSSSGTAAGRWPSSGGGTGMIGDPSGTLRGAQPARPRHAGRRMPSRSGRSWSGSSTSRRRRRRAAPSSSTTSTGWRRSG